MRIIEMTIKTYVLEVSETELARILFVMGKANGHTDGYSAYSQAYDIFGLDEREGAIKEAYHSLHEWLGVGFIDYNIVQEKWEKALGVGRFKKSPVQQRIENLEKELDELKKLL